MTRRLVLPLLLAALAAAGCGENSRDKFIDDYKPLNDRLLKVGQDLGTGLQKAEGKSNKALSEQFAAYALRLESVSKDIRRLETPGELEDESEALTSRIDAAVENLKEISGAAANNDAQAAATATVELATNSQALNRAQNRLAKATGARVGSS